MAEQQAQAGPGFTPICNNFFDEAFKEIDSLAEMKIVLLIIRKTKGWQKDQDVISYSQFIKETGLSRQSAAEGIEAGLKRGIITRIPAGQSFAYRLNPDYQVVKNVDQCSLPTSQDTRLAEGISSQASRPVPVKQVDTQKKELNKNKETNKEREGEMAVTTPPLTHEIYPIAPTDQEQSATVQGQDITKLPSSRQSKAASTANSQPAPVAKQIERGRAGAAPDPNSKLPAVQAYHVLFKLYPTRADMQRIAEIVTDLDTWQETLEWWQAHPKWDKLNVPAMLDYYTKKLAIASGVISYEQRATAGQSGRTYMAANGAAKAREASPGWNPERDPADRAAAFRNFKLA